MPRSARPTPPRRATSGKLLRRDGSRFFVKGVSYGTFAPDDDGWQFPSAGQVAHDLATMAEHGFNTVRLYTPPPPALLDEAARHGLQVVVGLPWSQHVAFLDDRSLRRRIRLDIEREARRVAAHPAVQMLAIGNEVPAPIVRWHGRRRVERFLGELYDAVKFLAPDRLVTYVNYPPTDYLDLPFLDVVAFNVYLHADQELRDYVARLHHVAGNRPLLLAEAGADSLRHGEEGQAALTSMQLRAAFEEGACGAIAFSWTDEWWRGGYAVEDWAFGLVDRDRRPKLALSAAARVLQQVPYRARDRHSWPAVSVVVCVYNAADTLADCLAGLGELDYPRLEVIVVDDGSTDGTAEIVGRSPFATLVRIPNGGLAAARNVGLSRATGDIVAYLDGDARPEPDWLTYLVQPFLQSGVAGAGGPNVVPPHDSWFAQCVARAPGGPSHVLLDDRIAEHIPGCNMAFRRDALLALDGFNPVFRRAGDDVDLCWRMQARGWKIAFASSALVWHHHRASVGAFWTQQVGYGESEAWLKPIHPAKFAGRRAIWKGHIYSALPFVRALRRAKVNAGVWGSAAFPSVYRFDGHPLAYLPHSGRWQATAGALLAIGVALQLSPASGVGVALGATGAAALLTTVARCWMYAWRTDIEALPGLEARRQRSRRLAYRAVLAGLHFIQPMARMHGRVRGYFSTPQPPRPAFRQTTDAPVGVEGMPPVGGAMRSARLLVGLSVESRFWSERPTSVEAVLAKLTDWIRFSRAVDLIEVDDGWRIDRDLSVANGRLVWIDLRAVVEDHGSGRSLLRIATRARPTRLGGFVAGVAAGATALAAFAGVAGSAVAASAGLAVVVLAVPAALWPVMRTSRAIRDAIGKVADEMELMPMDTPRRRRHAAPADATGARPPGPVPRGVPTRASGPGGVLRPHRTPAKGLPRVAGDRDDAVPASPRPTGRSGRVSAAGTR